MTNTIAETAMAIWNAVNEGRGYAYKKIEPVGHFHATSAGRPGGGLSHFLFRYEMPRTLGSRIWSIEIDAAKKSVIAMHGNIDSLDDYTTLLNDLSKFRIFHQ